ncbi:hypothetical protein H0W26_05105 [Candidatus Dependentiae bacterium]|nr:hypothetical protein [Candidatus Dependentiae bacterium]
MGSHCAHCGKSFRRHPAVRNHRYCSVMECQNERKRQWRIEKRGVDDAYRDNQADAQRAWCKRNPGYWAKYRASHPGYAERNRNKQQERDRQRRGKGVLAKSDALTAKPAVISGRYRLIPLQGGVLAKSDELIVQIGYISTG